MPSAREAVAAALAPKPSTFVHFRKPIPLTGLREKEIWGALIPRAPDTVVLFARLWPKRAVLVMLLPVLR